jgi:subtilase family serine protease
MRCRNCRKLVPREDKFCVYCGARISKGLPVWASWLLGLSLTGIVVVLFFIYLLPNIIEDGISSTTNPGTSPEIAQKPDLAILDITWGSQEAVSGERILFKVIVVNQGQAIAEPSMLNFYIDDTYIDSEDFKPLYPLNTVHAVFPWDAQSGIHTIKAVADYGDLVSESDETNNEKEITLPEFLSADLIVQDVTWTPTILSANDKAIFTVTIKNQGGGRAVQSLVTYNVDGARSLQYYNIDILYAGQTDTATFSHSFTKDGIHTIEIIADAWNNVPESNEANNSKTITFTIK